ncbi:MAG: efflux RND transporter permease subunit [Spirochaetales bacterium]|nr:efflux RND transporter permease subunit [Spirochaetales bacterium]
MFLADLSIKRPVMISMFMIAFLLFGIIAFVGMPLNLMPDAEIPYITIQTVYAGAAPGQIEDLITKKIEDEISSISLLKNIWSYSLNSVSIIILEFDLDKDVDIALQDTKEKVDAVLNQLPDSAEDPVIQKIDISASPIMEVLVSGDIEPSELYYLANDEVKDRISQIPGVGSVTLAGGFEREIRVEFDNRTVYENSLNLTQIAGILAMANMDMPGGNIQNEEQDYSVNLEGQFTGTEELEELLIPTAAGQRKLGQLAEINPASEDVRQRVTYFNTVDNVHQKNSVLLSIIKSPEGNPVEVADGVKKILPELRQELPESVNLTITMDDSIFVSGTVNDTLSNILLGILFTAGILLFFLHDARSTLIVALSMPLSIIPSFIFLRQMGITLNLMSLMGLSTSVGVLVMNSVVVLENIFRHKSLGHGRAEAASRGTAEVTVSVIASAGTNIAVFLPLGTMGGIVGEFIGDFALTVVIATLFSLIISFTLTPMLASLILPDEAKEKLKISQKIEDFFKSMERGYAFILEKVLHNRGRSILLIGGTILLFLLSMAAFAIIPFEFQPAMDQSTVAVEVELQEDASLDQTAEIIAGIEEIIAQFEEVDQIISNLGSLSSMSQDTYMAKLNISLVDKEDRIDSDSILATKIGAALSDIPGATIRSSTSSGNAGGGSAPVTFYLQGNNLTELQEYSRLMTEGMKKIPGTSGVNSSVKPGKPEISLKPNRQNMSEMGVTMQDLAMAMRSAIDGIVMTQLKVDGREYNIRVTLADTEVSSYESIRNIPVSTYNGIYPLSYFARLDVKEGVNQLLRINKKSSVEVSSNLQPGAALSTVTGEVDKLAGEILPSNVTLKWGGDAEMMADTMMNMAFAFLIAVILTYMLLAAILEKVGQPLLILTTIPLSLIGVVALFLITGYNMNMISMMAIVMLVGMVVNNAILILDYTNQLVSKGMDTRSALLEACPTKLQPILMANIATILGMLPMALGIGASGAEMRQPMGLVSIGGLVASTFLTLFVIPAAENALVSGREEKKKRRAEQEIETEEKEEE